MGNETNPLVTVFIMIYNNVDALEETVASVMMQDYADMEVILSDDGSTKYDTDILREYEKRLKTVFKNVKIHLCGENIGTVRHLNRIIGIASGKYLFSCSCGDCFARKDTVSSLVAQMEKKNALILTTRRIDRYPDRDKTRPARWVGWALDLCPERLCDHMINKRNLLSGCCTFYTKELFDKYGLFDERYRLVEDYPYYISLLKKGVKIPHHDMITVVHRMSGGVSTGNVHPQVWKDIENLKETWGKDAAN